MSAELLAYFRLHLPNAGDAEDLVQVAFERVLDRGYRTPEFALRRIAARLLTDEYRNAPPEPAVSWESLVGDGTGLDHIPQFQTSELADFEFTEAHEAAVRSLPETTRGAYILGELRGLASREAGPLLGVSHTAATTRRESATTHIRKELALV